MKKNLFSIIVAFLLAIVPAITQAQATQNYTFNFGDLTDTSSPTFRPAGWVHYLAASYYTTGYEHHESDGPDGGAWLEAKAPYTSSYKYVDGFITPEVSGNVTIKVKKMTDAGLLHIGYSEDGEAPVFKSGYYYYGLQEYTGTVEGVEDLVTGEWGTITIPDVPEGTRLYFAPNYMGIAEFTADNATIVLKKQVAMSVIKDYTFKAIETEDHKTTLEFNVEITNKGDFDIEADEITITVVNASNNDAAFGSFTFDQAVPVGKTVKIEKKTLTGDYNFLTNEYGVTSSSFRFTEDYNEPNTSTTQTYDAVPYKPVFNLTYDAKSEITGREITSTSDKISEGITFEVAKTADTRTYYVSNTGSATLKIKSITVPEGFNVFPTSFEVAAGSATEFMVMLQAGVGFHKGTMTFTTDDDKTYDFYVDALIPAEGVWRESFEGDGLPTAGFMFENYWEQKVNDPAGMGSEGNEKWAYRRDTGDPTGFITPLIQTEEGSKLYLNANKYSNIGGEIEVFTSTDRTNWTSVYKIVANAGYMESKGGDAYFSTDPRSATCKNYGSYAWRIFEIPLPAGNCYVKINGYGVRVNDIIGPALVEVDHDMMYIGETTPAKAMVNNPYTSSVSFLNLNSKSETDYEVSLIVDGTKYPAIETEEFEAGATKEFTFKFYPHEAGTFPVSYEFVVGDYTVVSPDATITVSEEVAARDVQVGEYLISRDGPIDTYYKHSNSQIIYTTDKLNITNGSVITGISYIGYCANEATGNLTVYLQNTDDTEYDEVDEEATGSGWTEYYVAENIDNMTKVFDGEYTLPKTGTSSAFEGILPVTFDTPFKYTGSNLRVHVRFSLPRYAGSCNFAFDNSATPNGKQYIRFRTDSDLDDLDLVWKWSRDSYGFPVTIFNVEKDPAVVEGTITDDLTEAPVANADITFTSGDVIYNATTDEEGKYGVTIFQSDLAYDTSVTAKAYEDYANEATEFVAGEEVNTNDIAMSAILAESAFESDPENESEIEDVKAITLTLTDATSVAIDEAVKESVSVEWKGEAGTTSSTATVAVSKNDDEQSVITITLAEEAEGATQCDITIPAHLLYIEEGEDAFFNQEITLTFSIKQVEEEPTGISAANLKGNKFTVYNLKGVRVGENSLENLPADIYIIRKADGSTVKVVVK